MKVIIIGGGLAGLTLAALLSRHDVDTRIIERASQYQDSGYGIGLYSPGSRIFEDLGLYDQFLDRGQEISKYSVADQNGRSIASVSMSAVPDHILPFVMVRRSDLVDMLHQSCSMVDFTMNTEVDSAQDHGDHVELTYSDGSTEQADTVIFCDGRRSKGREQSGLSAKVVDSGWVYSTWWAREGVFDYGALVEHCGPGWFLGAYPVPGSCMYGLGAPASKAPSTSSPTATTRDHIRSTLSTLIEHQPALGDAIDDAEAFYQWRMADVRTGQWSKGRIALCGDAAATALPTAGVGASHAIASASVLAEELSQVRTNGVPHALTRYTQRCQQFVEMNVARARFTAKYSFLESPTLTWLRDRALARYPTGRILDQLTKSVSHEF